jgi:hypothetical protein
MRWFHAVHPWRVPCHRSAYRSGYGNALLAISAASAISAREKRNAQRRRERRGPAVSIESAMDGESAPTTHAPNQAAPVNAPVAFWFHAGRAWRRVTECWPSRRAEATVTYCKGNPSR